MTLVPFITVVMPIRNESRFIKETLMQITSQDYPCDRYEIIIADGMSDDGTREIVLTLSHEYPQIKLLDNQKRLSSAGRNIGFKNGKGDFFIVVDGHCYIPDNQLLRNVADCFEKSGADCLGRPQPLDPPGLTDFQKSVALARASRLGHGGDSMIFGEFEGFASPVSNGAAYARHVFEKIGYVDENFDAAEDVEFNYRVEQAGFTCFTSPRLTIRYYPREDLNGLMRQMQRYGLGRFKFISKHREALTVNQLVPACFMAGLVLLLINVFLSIVLAGFYQYLLPLLLIYAFYVVLVLSESYRISTRYGMQFFCLLPMIFFIVHCGMGIGFIKKSFNIR